MVQQLDSQWSTAEKKVFKILVNRLAQSNDVKAIAAISELSKIQVNAALHLLSVQNLIPGKTGKSEEPVQ